MKFSFFFFRLVGSIPGPILYGYIIDQTCLLKDGNCLFYDNYSMALAMSLTTVIIKTLGVGFFVLALHFSGKSNIRDETEELNSLK